MYNFKAWKGLEHVLDYKLGFIKSQYAWLCDGAAVFLTAAEKSNRDCSPTATGQQFTYVNILMLESGSVKKTERMIRRREKYWH